MSNSGVSNMSSRVVFRNGMKHIETISSESSVYAPVPFKRGPGRPPKKSYSAPMKEKEASASRKRVCSSSTLEMVNTSSNSNTSSSNSNTTSNRNAVHVPSQRVKIDNLIWHALDKACRGHCDISWYKPEVQRRELEAHEREIVRLAHLAKVSTIPYWAFAQEGCYRYDPDTRLMREILRAPYEKEGTVIHDRTKKVPVYWPRYGPLMNVVENDYFFRSADDYEEDLVGAVAQQDQDDELYREL